MRPTSPAGNGPDKERVLWVNVVLRAILDGTADQTDSRTDRDRREARAWFRLNNPDFVEVCNLAGLDPAATLKKARSVFERHDQAKAEGVPFKLASPAKPAKAPIAPTIYSAHGLTMRLSEWSRHLDIAPGTLVGRLKNHPPEIALSKDFKRAPRVSRLKHNPAVRGARSNLKAFEGTGAGSAAQETPELDFSEMDRK
ncbi:hypothetical protein [Aquibium microcysteis]|uniref:hypothetical protein n=1 Tax=Aquibium microcysteis TaxID=675281 RepID=UPI00165D2A77|nr:hypothetical protein [Aquibium microcysteis]